MTRRGFIGTVLAIIPAGAAARAHTPTPVRKRGIEYITDPTDNLPVGLYYYRYTFIDANGNEIPPPQLPRTG